MKKCIRKKFGLKYTKNIEACEQTSSSGTVLKCHLSRMVLEHNSLIIQYKVIRAAVSLLCLLSPRKIIQ